MTDIKTHKDLLVWQKSIDLVLFIYELTKRYPKEELYAITNQTRRCVTSIPANIAEGSGRRGKSEFIQFLHIALGSASELETFLIIAQKLKYISEHDYEKADKALNEVIRMLIGLINSIKQQERTTLTASN
ncbi:MAG: four helix bundle protein [Bacteroides sp.]